MVPPDSSGLTPAERAAVVAATAANALAVAALLDAERRAVATVAAPYRRLLSELFRRLLAQWVLIVGALDRPATPDQAAALLRLLSQGVSDLADLDPTPDLIDATRSAAALGWDYANRDLPPIDDAGRGVVYPEVDQIIEQVPAAIRRAIAAVDDFARAVPVATWSDLTLHMAKASQVATGLERQTAVAVERAHSDSIQRAAVLRGARLLWIAEPDACVVCLALSGHLSDPATGDWFDELATFGRPGSAPAVWPPGHPLKGPPRHPYCRCVLELWFGPAVPAGSPGDNSLYGTDIGSPVDLPSALRREAKRSVLYGWSLPSESNTVRLEAASRLLALGAGLPRSVEDRARRAVRTQHFDNRIHPARRSPRR